MPCSAFGRKNVMFDWYAYLRPLLFLLDPEKAHALSLQALHYCPAACFPKIPSAPVQAMGLTFPHRVGLAAGLDKNGRHLEALSKLGFSFIEVGTVTPKAQQGNPKPRLFRLQQANALLNRMGFNNEGVDALLRHLQNTSYEGILGINIGKNKNTSLAQAAEDYRYCFAKAYARASYVSINISSPNTPELRQLQQEDFFADLLSTLQKTQQELAEKHKRWVPLVVKVSPDEETDVLKRMSELALKYGVSGLIATNTTCSRKGVEQFALAQEAGGLSGAPLRDRSLACLALLKAQVGDALTLIGVGGIANALDAQAKLDAGATLVQLYSGLIYQGPHLVYETANHLSGIFRQ